LEQTTQTCIAKVMSNSDLARPRPMECTGNWTKSSYRAKLAEVEAAIAAGSAGPLKRWPAATVGAQLANPSDQDYGAAMFKVWPEMASGPHRRVIRTLRIVSILARYCCRCSGVNRCQVPMAAATEIVTTARR
jgi:hypothetical protein